MCFIKPRTVALYWIYTSIAYQALRGGRGGCNMGGANALAGSLWPLPEWGPASTIIRESTVHLIAHQCVRVFFRLGIFRSWLRISSIAIDYVDDCINPFTSIAKPRKAWIEGDWMEEGPAVQAMTLNLTLNARRCLVGAEGLVHICSHHTSSSYFYC